MCVCVFVSIKNYDSDYESRKKIKLSLMRRENLLTSMIERERESEGGRKGASEWASEWVNVRDVAQGGRGMKLFTDLAACVPREKEKKDCFQLTVSTARSRQTGPCCVFFMRVPVRVPVRASLIMPMLDFFANNSNTVPTWEWPYNGQTILL